ncbi:hypothetical protein H7992_14260 [Sporosarcina sp. resist]|uniref:hypothetical protein n=1 Tax=Sporosarcina sp. resist TaxID=2762563 RepID=UPI00164E2B93|nr:hypothetical protein [Sporosarcina sp. resist]QNK86422.1 hypothetical protein H7992_14260 [Sporosarcina sp. resist]
MGWIEPRLDWKSIDFYNFGDLNRVENNVAVVADLLRYFIPVPDLVIVANRSMTRIETAPSLNRIERNSNLLRERYTPSGWLEHSDDWATLSPFTYKDAFRLENNMFLLYTYYIGNIGIQPVCGAFICGEEAI